MDEVSGKVQNASTQPLSRKIHEYTRTATSQFINSRGRWTNFLGRFKMQALTSCHAKIMSTRAQQPVSSRALEDMSRTVQNASTYTSSVPSCNIEPNQLGRPAGLDVEDPATALRIEDHTSRHLRLDGHGAADAECSAAAVGAHVAAQLVRARRQHDLCWTHCCRGHW